MATWDGSSRMSASPEGVGRSGQYRGAVDGCEYVVGLHEGRIGQLYRWYL